MKKTDLASLYFKFIALIGVITLSLNSCSSGGGKTTTTPTLSGAVLDGYITGANVCLDLNGNGKCESGEPTGTTTVNGAYTLDYSSSVNTSNLNVIVTVPVGAIDSNSPNTPIAAPYQLAAPATQAAAVTPLTTLVVAAIEANPSLTPTTAASQVTTALGLPSTVNLFQNYISTGNTAVNNVAQVVNVVVQNSALANSTSSAVTASTLNSVLTTAQTYATQAYSTTGSVSTLLASATVAAANGALITTVPVVTYTQTDALAVYNQLSNIRANGGFGLLAESIVLDTAANSHANYLVNNNLASNGSYLYTMQSGTLGGHFESSSNSGFTGATPQARATAAGYAGTVTELNSFGAAGGAACLASIEDSVYHLSALVSPYVEVGIGYNAGVTSSPGASVCDIELGVRSSSIGQFPAAGTYAVYPYNGQTGVLPTFYNQAEVPTPAPDLSLAGHPILISFYNLTSQSLQAANISINSFVVTTSTGASVPVRIIAMPGVNSNGPSIVSDSNLAGPGFVIALPTSPLNANTTYNITVNATISGTTMTKNWAFTTGTTN